MDNSETNAALVLDGLRRLSQQTRTQHLYTLSEALAHEDVETKTSILLFVNTLIMACAESDRLALRGSLKAVFYEENALIALQTLDEELHSNNPILIAAHKQQQQQQQEASGDQMGSLVSLHGRRAFDQRTARLLHQVRASSYRPPCCITVHSCLLKICWVEVVVVVLDLSINLWFDVLDDHFPF